MMPYYSTEPPSGINFPVNKILGNDWKLLEKRQLIETDRVDEFENYGWDGISQTIDRLTGDTDFDHYPGIEKYHYIIRKDNKWLGVFASYTLDGWQQCRNLRDNPGHFSSEVESI